MTTQELDASAVDTDAVAGGEDPGEMGIGRLVGALASVAGHSTRLLSEAGTFAVEAARIVAGRSEIEPDRKDWRFKDPAWTENPLYRRTAQGYLAATQSVRNVVESADVDWRTREKARFAAELLTSAAAPTNTLLGNPAACKRAFETMGASLVRGLGHFVNDVRHNGGMPSQVDRRPFVVGETLAATPGAVVFRNELLELLQYRPTTTSVYERPCLMVVPQINKYYFMDLAPGRSFVEYAVSRGIQFFAVSWRNPTAEQADWDLDRYAAAILEATDAVRDITGSDDLNTLSLCAGGITTAALLSHLAAVGDDRVNAAAFGVTLLDFDVPAPIGAFSYKAMVSSGRRRSGKHGILDGASLARVFALVRPNDLIWNYWVNNYLMGNDPPAFDILAWNSDSTNLPGALHAQFLDIFSDNVVCRPGALEVLGTPVDLSRVKIDTYVTGATTDHLTPWRGCYRATQLLGGASTFVLSNAGHIQSLINPPGNPKAHYWAGPEPGVDPDAWLRAAERRSGTWWEDWADWSIERSGAERDAPDRLGSDRYPAIEDAPGQYVR